MGRKKGIKTKIIDSDSIKKPSESGLSHHLFQGMQALVGRFKGGVALAVIGACAAFGAVSGSSIATASTMS